MIFNSQPNIANLLQSSYSTGNCVFSGDYLYSPLGNSVKKVDLHKNQTSLLPFQNSHYTALIALSPNNTLLVAFDFTGHATLFNLAGSFIVGQFNFKSPVRQAVFSPNGKMLAVGQEHGFSVYECSALYRSFEPLVLIKKYKSRHAGNICGLQFSRDNRFLLSSGEDNIIYINNLFPIPDYLPITLEVHRYKIVATHFSHDMSYLYTFDAGSNLVVWKWITQTTEAYNNLRDAKKRARNNQRGVVVQQQNQLNVNQEAYSDFEKKITQGRFILSKKLSLNQGGYLKKVVFKPEMGFLAGAYSNGKFSIWKLVGQQLEEIQCFAVVEHKISALAINDSCTWLALGIKALGQIIVWQWKSQSYILNQRGLIHQTRQIAYNSVNLIATGTNEGSVRLWDSTSNFCIATLLEHQAAVSGLRFSNANTLFSCSLDGSVNAYDVQKQKKFRNFQPDVRCQLVCLEVDNNGEVVFAGGFDPYDVYSWNVQTGHLLQVISGHQGPIACLAFAQNTLVSASWDHTVKIHAIFARKLNVETLEHGSQITAIATNPSQTQVAVATMKGQIYLWQPESGRMDGVLQSEMSGGRSYSSKVSAENDPSNKYLKALAYSPCGKYLYGGGKSKYLHVYDISHRMLLTKICLTINRDIQGVIDKLNSRYIKNGVATYEMELQAQNQVYSEDQHVQKLPGSKKIDISEIRTKLEVEVKKIIVKSSRQLLITTSFGTLLLSSIQSKTVFNPYHLAPSLTPKIIPQLIMDKQFTSALLVSLKLNINPRKLLRKIPIEHVKAVICELQPQFAELLVQKLCEQGKVGLRELTWLEHLLRQGYRPSVNLRGALQCLQDQVKLLSQVQGCLELAGELNSLVE